ncbi:hypothetical protein AAFF_G00142270 [Aldrovandia affinis]|uniref:IQ calmodulin-binding motif domain-containing protein n=1 Tax=Aldrovandia affinis TaxID=143900 RepID=A0AAD7WWU3_9TELE|nr:hypothetical protein AAFF_G00142270 [Aldrovandia affinis]
MCVCVSEGLCISEGFQFKLCACVRVCMCVSVSLFLSLSVEGEPQTGSFSDSLCRQAPYLRGLDRYGDGPRGPPVAPPSPASIAWAQRTRHQPASLALRKQEEEENKRCKALSDSYELSTDLQDKKVEMLERKYGGYFLSRRAARTIQTAFRQYRMNKNFERLRSSASESRLTRRIILSNMRLQYSFDDRQPQPGAPHDPPAERTDYTHLEDSFSKQSQPPPHLSVRPPQVKSLADSIDDALTCRPGRDDSQEGSAEGGGADFRECVWSGSGHALSRRGRGEQPRGGLSTHEDSTATSYSDVTLYMDDGLPSSPSRWTGRPAALTQSTGARRAGAGAARTAATQRGAAAAPAGAARPAPSAGTTVSAAPTCPCSPSSAQRQLGGHERPLGPGSLSRQLVYEQDPGGGSPQGTLKHSPAASSTTATAQGQTRTPRPMPAPIATHIPHHAAHHHHHPHHHQYPETPSSSSSPQQPPTTPLSSASSSAPMAPGSLEQPCCSDGDNDSLNSTTNSNETINCSSGSSSRDSLREPLPPWASRPTRGRADTAGTRPPSTTMWCSADSTALASTSSTRSLKRGSST